MAELLSCVPKASGTMANLGVFPLYLGLDLFSKMFPKCQSQSFDGNGPFPVRVRG